MSMSIGSRVLMGDVWEHLIPLMMYCKGVLVVGVGKLVTEPRSSTKFAGVSEIEQE